MTEKQSVVMLLIFGLILLSWGLHGVVKRKNFNHHHYTISLAQIMAGSFSIIGVIIYFLQNGF